MSEDEQLAWALQESLNLTKGSGGFGGGESSKAHMRRSPPPRQQSYYPDPYDFYDDDDAGDADLQLAIKLSSQLHNNSDKGNGNGKGKGKGRHKAPASSSNSNRNSECKACLEPITGTVHKSSCNCTYCSPCLTQLLTHSLSGDTGSFPPTCCKQPIPAPTLRLAVPTSLYTRYTTRAAEKAAGPSALFCPNPSCKSALIPPSLIKGPTVCCPSCSTQICVSCRKLQHSGICKKDKADQQLEELQHKEDWRKCPTCKRVIDKMYESCNHMTCPCGAEWCWECGHRWVPRECQCPVWNPDSFEATLELERREGPLGINEEERRAGQEQLIEFRPVGPPRALVNANANARPLDLDLGFDVGQQDEFDVGQQDEYVWDRELGSLVLYPQPGGPPRALVNANANARPLDLDLEFDVGQQDEFDVGQQDVYVWDRELGSWVLYPQPVAMPRLDRDRNRGLEPPRWGYDSDQYVEDRYDRDPFTEDRYHNGRRDHRYGYR